MSRDRLFKETTVRTKEFKSFSKQCFTFVVKATFIHETIFSINYLYLENVLEFIQRSVPPKKNSHICFANICIMDKRTVAIKV